MSIIVREFPYRIENPICENYFIGFHRIGICNELRYFNFVDHMTEQDVPYVSLPATISCQTKSKYFLETMGKDTVFIPSVLKKSGADFLTFINYALKNGANFKIRIYNEGLKLSGGNLIGLMENTGGFCCIKKQPSLSKSFVCKRSFLTMRLYSEDFNINMHFKSFSYPYVLNLGGYYISKVFD